MSQGTGIVDQNVDMLARVLEARYQVSGVEVVRIELNPLATLALDFFDESRVARGCGMLQLDGVHWIGRGGRG